MTLAVSPQSPDIAPPIPMDQWTIPAHEPTITGMPLPEFGPSPAAHVEAQTELATTQAANLVAAKVREADRIAADQRTPVWENSQTSFLSSPANETPSVEEAREQQGAEVAQTLIDTKTAEIQAKTDQLREQKRASQKENLTLLAESAMLQSEGRKADYSLFNEKAKELDLSDAEMSDIFLQASTAARQKSERPMINPHADPEAADLTLYGLKTRNRPAFEAEYAKLTPVQQHAFDKFEAQERIRINQSLQQAGHSPAAVSAVVPEAKSVWVKDPTFERDGTAGSIAGVLEILPQESLENTAVPAASTPRSNITANSPVQIEQAPLEQNSGEQVPPAHQPVDTMPQADWNQLMEFIEQDRGSRPEYRVNTFVRKAARLGKSALRRVLLAHR